MPIRLFNDAVKREDIKEKDKKYLPKGDLKLSPSLSVWLPPLPLSAPELPKVTLRPPKFQSRNPTLHHHSLESFSSIWDNLQTHMYSCTSEIFLLYLSCWLASYLFAPFLSFTFLIQFPCSAFYRKMFAL